MWVPLSFWSDDLEGALYQMMDLNCRLLDQGSLQSDRIAIDHQRLEAGVYQLLIQQGKYQRAFRIMIL